MADKLKPLTFKVPKFMLDKIEDLVENGIYKNKAELIREAIQLLIDWEMKIDPISSFEQD